MEPSSALLAFRALPRADQLEQLTCAGELLPISGDPEASYYRLGDHYVRVHIASSPLAVGAIEAMDEEEMQQRLLAEAAH